MNFVEDTASYNLNSLFTKLWHFSRESDPLKSMLYWSAVLLLLVTN